MWEAWFHDNLQIIYFGYGLVFVLMGFAVALTVRNFRGSRLALTASLPYLAAFGLLLGMAEWGVVFLPLQAAYLSPPRLHTLALVQSGMLALAYVSLLSFGLTLVFPRATRIGWWPQLGALLLMSALVPLGGLANLSGGDLAGLRHTVHMVAAWGVGVPGSLLGTLGLWRQRLEIARYYPSASRWLLVAGGILLLSAPLGVLAIPASPADVMENLSVQTIAGIPVQAVLAAGGLLLTVSLVMGLEVFRVENARRHEQAALKEAAMEERFRIGQELNDGTIQELFAATLLIDSAVADLQSEQATAAQSLSIAVKQLRETIERLRRFIAELEPLSLPADSLEAGVRQLVDEFSSKYLIPVQLSIPSGLEVPHPVAREVWTVIYEALTNVARHAGASAVRLTISKAENQLVLQILDNGKGMPPGQQWRTGLERMHRRAKSVGGHLFVGRAHPRGTVVRMEVPLPPT